MGGVDMKRLLLGGSVLIAISAGPALAADLRVKAPVQKAPPPITYTWTGCYVGGNVGGAWNSTSTTSDNKPGANFGDETDTSFIGGGQLGCDFQAGAWVFGVQGMFDAARLNGSRQIPAFPTFIYNNNISWLTTATDRIGYAVQPALLIYAKGGFAWARNNITVNFTVPRLGLSESATDDRLGWVVGGGLEYMLFPSLSVFAEYNYLGFGTKTIAFIPAPSTAGVPDVLDIRQNIQTFMVGLNWHPNLSGLISANH
jgi:outer membrane immunogenic protein